MRVDVPPVVHDTTAVAHYATGMPRPKPDLPSTARSIRVPDDVWAGVEAEARVRGVSNTAVAVERLRGSFSDALMVVGSAVETLDGREATLLLRDHPKLGWVSPAVLQMLAVGLTALAARW